VYRVPRHKSELARVLKEFKQLHEMRPEMSLHVLCEVAVEGVVAQPNVFLYQNVDRERMTEELCKSGFWYIPDDCDETFNNFALLSLQSGCIPLYNRVGSLPEIVSKSGVSFPADGAGLVIALMMGVSSDSMELLYKRTGERASLLDEGKLRELWLLALSDDRNWWKQPSWSA
jgi:hypothetical protein